MKIDKYDIVGYKIISPLHLAALLAYASRFTGNNKIVRVLVVVSNGPWGRSILSHYQSDRNEIELDFIDEKYFDFTPSPAQPIYLMLMPAFTMLSWALRRKRKPICAPTMASVKFVASSLYGTIFYRPVVLDEGIGSFNSGPGFIKEAQRRAKTAVGRSFLVWIYTLLWSNLKPIGAERVSLFRFINGHPSINQDIAMRYKSTFLQTYKLRNRTTVLEPNTILILTQPFSEMGICSEIELLDTVQRIADRIHALGAKPVIKTHPVEIEGKYKNLNVNFLIYDGAVEEIYASNYQHIREVWGFHSTALITGSALYNLKTKALQAPWRSEFLEGLDTEADALYRKYTESFKI